MSIKASVFQPIRQIFCASASLYAHLLDTWWWLSFFCMFPDVNFFPSYRRRNICQTHLSVHSSFGPLRRRSGRGTLFLGLVHPGNSILSSALQQSLVRRRPSTTYKHWSLFLFTSKSRPKTRRDCLHLELRLFPEFQCRRRRRTTYKFLWRLWTPTPMLTAPVNEP